jgi:hypothetical protein
MHACNKEDLSGFYEPSKANEKSINRIKRSDTLLCVDKQDLEGNPIDWKIWGMTEDDAHRRIDFKFMPCKPV